ncbi:hypothetical protein AWW67_13825 [Roseivirga seohaensis]|uniref:ABC transporter ATP-binding protein n=1 Tax=Roseivirga seohaensis TaxID=1914963 RepID=A0A150XL88_9BACT|nr:ABC transporter ATP-binding protein [Roseivirga seohaensis]KYG79443.1 hypothetical protein AWW67_13825 [Roseivirga seohaensis]
MNTSTKKGVIQRIAYLLSPKEKRSFNQIVLWLSLRVIFDLASIASLLPLILSYFKPEILRTNKLWLNITSFLGVELERTTAILILFVAFFFLIKFIYFYIIEKRKAHFLTKTQHRLVVEVYDNIQSIVMTDFSHYNTGHSLENIAQVPSKYVFQCLATILRIIPNAITITLILLSLVLFQWKIFLIVCLVFVPILILYLLSLKRPIKKVEQSFSRLNPVFLQRVAEALTGRIEIALFQKGDFFRKRIEESSKELMKTTARLLTLSNSAPYFLELISITGIGVFFYYITTTEFTPEKSITILSVFILSIAKIIPSLNGIVSASTNLKAYIYTVDLLKNIISKEAQEGKPVRNVGADITFKGEIKFDNVSVKYPESDFTLPEISIILKPTDKLAVVGESGSGKSTILKLMLKLVPANSGSITVDGKLLDDIESQNWWSQVAYVPQSSFIFSGTLLENLTFGKQLSTSERKDIVLLLHELKLQSLLSSRSDGLDSVIEENGLNLSTGQRQRIGIARAILQNKLIYVFDEATGGLDESTSAEIMDSLIEGYLKNRLCVFATHDLLVKSKCTQVLNLS